MYEIKLPIKPFALMNRWLIVLIAILFMFLGGGLTWKFLSPDQPPAFLQGQQIAQSMTVALSNDESVLNSSGVYVPETGVFIYTQTEEVENFVVRQWATLHLLSFNLDLATLPDDESLVWLIDYGSEQEMVTLPLGIITDPTVYEFVSLPGRPVLDRVQDEIDTGEAVPEVVEEIIEIEEGEQQVVEIIPPTSNGTEIIAVVPVQNTAPVPFTNTTVRTDFEGGVAADWSPFAGNWQVVDGAYHQTDEFGFDFGTSLGFRGDDYSLTADVRYLAGDMGAGFYYNMTNPDSKIASQMVNFADGGKALQWGHFNETGEFTFTGITPVSNVADGEWHTLQVTVNQGIATIILNDEIVAEGISLVYTSGYVGLLASESHVAFDNIVISPQGSINLGTATPIDALYDFEDGNADNWLAIEGDWVMVDGRYEQKQQLGWDRISVLNNKMVGPYRLSSEMLHIEGEMGAGLIFNMQQRNIKAFSHLISFTARGSFLQWGFFDQDGVFIYQNGVNVENVSDGEWHELAVEVFDSTYSISLNGNVIAFDIPLLYTDGFVGLLDGQSWVAFDNVKLVGRAQSTSIDTGIDAEDVESEVTTEDEVGSEENELEPVDIVEPELPDTEDAEPEQEGGGDEGVAVDPAPADDGEQDALTESPPADDAEIGAE